MRCGKNMFGSLVGAVKTGASLLNIGYMGYGIATHEGKEYSTKSQTPPPPSSPKKEKIRMKMKEKVDRHSSGQVLESEEPLEAVKKNLGESFYHVADAVQAPQFSVLVSTASTLVSLASLDQYTRGVVSGIYLTSLGLNVVARGINNLEHITKNKEQIQILTEILHLQREIETILTPSKGEGANTPNRQARNAIRQAFESMVEEGINYERNGKLKAAVAEDPKIRPALIPLMLNLAASTAIGAAQGGLTPTSMITTFLSTYSAELSQAELSYKSSVLEERKDELLSHTKVKIDDKSAVDDQTDVLKEQLQNYRKQVYALKGLVNEYQEAVGRGEKWRNKTIVKKFKEKYSEEPGISLSAYNQQHQSWYEKTKNFCGMMTSYTGFNRAMSPVTHDSKLEEHYSADRYHKLRAEALNSGLNKESEKKGFAHALKDDRAEGKSGRVR